MAAASIGTAWIQIKPTMKGVGKEISKELNSSETRNAGKSAGSGIGIGIVAGLTASIASAGLNKIMSTISSSIGSAISRVDTFANSERTFKNLGFSAESTEKAMSALEKSITGLPTPLDSAIRGMTGLAATYDDVELGQKVFTALNNAILGFGGTSAMVENAITQLSQLPLDGPLDAQTWNSLRNSGFTPVFTAMAKQSGMTVGALKKDFSGEGTKTVEDFIDTLLKMDKEGGGGMASLEQIAKDSTSGIGTSFTNMKTAVTRGLADVIDTLGSANIADVVTKIGKAFEDALKGISSLITFVAENKDVFLPIAAGITAIASALLLYNAYVKISAVLTGIYSAAMFYFNTVSVLTSQGIGLVRASMMALNIVFAANPIGILVLAIVGLVAALVTLWHTNEGFRNFVTEAWEKIKNIFMGVFNWVKENWPLLLAILTGPIGLAVLAIIRNFDTILNFVKGMPGKIVGFFKNVGQKIGDTVGGAIKGAINGIIGVIENTINGAIGLINGAIGIINKLPGVSVGTISNINIPRLAAGGVITSPTLALIGEGRESEAVIPLSKLDSMLDNKPAKKGEYIFNITVNGTFATSEQEKRRVAEQIVRAINQNNGVLA